MVCPVSVDDLKTIMLKCVGSKYPVRIVLKNDLTHAGYVRGFADSDCRIMLLANAPNNMTVSELNIDEVRYVETLFQITLDRLRSRKFSVSEN